jgi:hypothetical protein
VTICCESATACVFAKALLAHAAVCERAVRRSLAERELVACGSPVARTNCGTLAALMHERARLPLRLPRPDAPLAHAQALRLHCGGLQGLRLTLDADCHDVHRLVGLAHERHGSLTDLPWERIVAEVRAWQPRPRRAPSLP